MVRWEMGASIEEHRRNWEVLEETRLEPIVMAMASRRLEWFGHVKSRRLEWFGHVKSRRLEWFGHVKSRRLEWFGHVKRRGESEHIRALSK